MVATLIRTHEPSTQADGAAVISATPAHNFSRLLSSDIGTGASFTYATDEGDKVYQLSQGSTGTIWAYDTWTGAQTDFALQFEIELDNTPSTTCTLFQFFSDDAYGSSAVNLNIQLASGSPSGRLRVRNNATATDYTASAALAVGTRYTCQFRYRASTQTATLTVYVKGSTTVFVSVEAAVPTNTQINSMRFGIGTASTGLNYKLKKVIIGYGDLITRTDVAAATPVVTRGHQERQMYQAGAAVPLQWSASISNDTIQSAVITWPYKPAGAADPTVTHQSGSPGGIGTANVTVNATAVLPSIGYYRAQLTVTPAGGGAASTSTLSFGMYPAPETRTIIQEVILDGFTVVGGPPNTAAGAATALNDTDLTTLLESILSGPNPVHCRIRFGPQGPTALYWKAVSDVVGGGTYSRKFTWRTDDETYIFDYTRSAISAQTPLETYNFPSAALAAIAMSGPNDVKRYGLILDIDDTWVV